MSCPTERGEAPGESPEDRLQFIASLNRFLSETVGATLNSAPAWRVPVIANEPLDLCRLYRLVALRGGMSALVAQGSQMRAVVNALGLGRDPIASLPPDIVLRAHYDRFLAGYEARYLRRQGSSGGDGPPDAKRPRLLEAPPAPRLLHALPAPPSAAAAATEQTRLQNERAKAMLSLLRPSPGPYLVLPGGWERRHAPQIALSLLGGGAEVAVALNVLALATAAPGRAVGLEPQLSVLPRVLAGLLHVLRRGRPRAPGTRAQLPPVVMVAHGPPPAPAAVVPWGVTSSDEWAPPATPPSWAEEACAAASVLRNLACGSPSNAAALASPVALSRLLPCVAEAGHDPRGDPSLTGDVLDALSLAAAHVDLSGTGGVAPPGLHGPWGALAGLYPSVAGDAAAAPDGTGTSRLGRYLVAALVAAVDSPLSSRHRAGAEGLARLPTTPAAVKAMAAITDTMFGPADGGGIGAGTGPSLVSRLVTLCRGDYPLETVAAAMAALHRVVTPSPGATTALAAVPGVGGALVGVLARPHPSPSARRAAAGVLAALATRGGPAGRAEVARRSSLLAEVAFSDHVAGDASARALHALSQHAAGPGPRP